MSTNASERTEQMPNERISLKNTKLHDLAQK